MNDKVEVIVVSAALRANEALKFRNHFKDLFEGYFVHSGKYWYNGNRNKYPLWEIVRQKKKDEEICEDFVKVVDRNELSKIIVTKNTSHSNLLR